VPQKPTQSFSGDTGPRYFCHEYIVLLDTTKGTSW